MIATTHAVCRLARQARVASDAVRSSRAVLLLGGDGRVRHAEHGVLYCLDVTRCMFSSGNVTERGRMGALCCAGEIVVDMFAVRRAHFSFGSSSARATLQGGGSRAAWARQLPTSAVAA